MLQESLLYVLRCLVRAVRSELSRGGWNCYCTYWEFLCQFANGNSKVHDTMQKCFHLATSFSEMELPCWKFLVNKKNILDHSFWAYLPILGGGMSLSILLVPMPLLDHHSGCNSGFSAIPLARTGNALSLLRGDQSTCVASSQTDQLEGNRLSSGSQVS